MFYGWAYNGLYGHQSLVLRLDNLVLMQDIPDLHVGKRQL
jgi:hypothetical protein